MPTYDPWILAFSYWFHMIATIVWVGGLALMSFVVWPGARAVLGSGPQLASVLREFQRRFEPLGWGCLAVLIVTGLTQMSANENYTGLLQVTNSWALAILLKHIAIFGMILIGLYMQFSVHPALTRLSLLEARGLAAPGADALRRSEATLTRLNLLCGILVLGLTAIARVV